MAKHLLTWAYAALLTGVCRGAAIVSSIEPRYIGYGGGAITIYGEGFSEDVFNQFDPILGNKVWFANEFVSVICQTPINWNFLLENPQDPSTTKIVCDLPPRDGSEGSDWFNLILKVDGVEVSNEWSVNYKDRQTPKIKDVLPRYGKPGDSVSLSGTIFTKEYGNANFGDSGSVENRREESLTAVMMGQRECELTDDLGNVYSMTLDSEDSNEGQVTCAPGGSFIGPMNATIFVSGKYGKSQVESDGNGYSVNSKNQLFMYHTLPEVTSITPNVGASSGSTQVKITGNSFDSFADNTVVMIGRTPCNIVSIQNDELICSTPAEADVVDSSAGTRGLLYEIWTATEGDVADISSLDSSAADYQSMTLDGSTVSGPYFNETNGFTARVSGLFVAPYTGKISFYLLTSDQAKLYLSTDDDPINKVEIVSHSAPVNEANPGSPDSEAIEVVEGSIYYIEAVHVQRSSAAEENNLQVALWEHKTIYHKKQSTKAVDERQRLLMEYNRNFETQSITFDGIADDQQITFTHKGINSKAPVSLAAASQMSATLTDMLTYSCEYLNTASQYKNDFEKGKWLTGQSGYVQENVQAYCGKNALENQGRVISTYDEEVGDINADRTPWFCFAAMGSSYNGNVQLLVLWTDENDNARRDWLVVPNVWEPTDDWSYSCLNMYDSVKNETISWLRPKQNTRIEIQDIILNTGYVTGSYYMDEITISSSAVEILRKSPALTTLDIMIREVNVAAGETEGTYDVEIVPWTCNTVEDDLSLFGVNGANIIGLDTSSMTPEEKWSAEQWHLKTMDSATFSSSEWGSGTITVKRKVRGSRATTGSFDLSHKGNTISLPPYPTEKSLASALEAFGMIGAKVWYRDNKCYRTMIDIQFTSSNGGDLEQIEIDSSNLVTDDAGSVKYQMSTVENGGFMVSNPGGDFFRKASTGKEICVYVGGFLSSCSASDCSFGYDSSLNPTLSGVSGVSDTSSKSINLNITGTGFSTVSTENIVSLENLECVVQSSAATFIFCELEAGPSGVYDVSVIVVNAGAATGGPLTYEVPMEIFSNTPEAGSVGGGTTITVDGFGFPSSMEGWASGSVMIDGSECKVKETNFDSFKCLTSAQIVAGRRKRAASQITVVTTSSTAYGGWFEYSSSLTPVVSSLSTYTSTPLGGEELTIEGIAFGAAWGQVLIGESECTILTWFPTSISCTIPSNSHGTYPVHVSVPGNGFADVSNIEGISYNFIVKGMSPRKGSLMGGTKVSLEGEGFGNCSGVEVSLGNTYDCKIEECTDSAITCTTERKSDVVQITNSGRHPTYGPGYIWSETDLTISPGDTVRWVWNLQVASDETKISVHQTENGVVDEYDGSGFKSMKAANGGFSKRFMNTGVYYYSSEPVFGDSLFMKGVIRVVSPSADVEVALSVSMNSIEAAQEISADSGSVMFSDCAVSGDQSCADDPVSGDTYVFKGAQCLTPVINSIEIIEGGSNSNMSTLAVYNGAKLSLTGSGFSVNSCQNVVNIGESKCLLESASSSELLCVIDGSDADITSLESHGISLTVLNTGKAVLETESGDSEIYLMPKIDSANIDSGSWAGGNIFMLSGSALIPEGGLETVMITFGEYPYAFGCSVLDITYSSISCVVPDFASHKGSKTSMSVDITVNMGYDSNTPSITPGQLSYEFSDELTSKSTSMDASSAVASDVVTLTGENFGTSVRVYLQKADTARYRRRAQLKKRDISSFQFMQADETSNHFWSIISDEPINWKCASGNCDHDELVGGMASEPTVRRKRSLEEDEELNFRADSNKMSLIDDICRSDVSMCQRMVLGMSKSSHNIVKRATNEELLEMSISGEIFEAEVSSVSSTSISFEVPALPAGNFNVIVNVDGQGNSISSLGQLQSNMVVSSVMPAIGSINGGQLITITGSGFCTSEGSTLVNVGSGSCEVSDVSPGSITCITPAGADGSATVSVESCSVTATGDYTYSSSQSPEITSINPSSASGPVSLTIIGSNLGSSALVTVGDHTCTVTSSSDSSVSCDLSALPGGQYAVSILNGNVGSSNMDITFESSLNIESVSPSAGSFGGGSLIIIDGTGFDDIKNPSVSICSGICSIVNVTTTEIQCLSPANSESGATEDCDVTVTQDSGSITSSNAFTYDRSLTPTVDSVSPLRGGTGGGTKITISGSGFAATGNVVQIDGSICSIETESTSEITCYTNTHNGAIESPVNVDVPTQGYADYSDVAAATFYYIDRWSSIWTWGGTGTPMEGEYIVITNGQTILLDESTPTLKFLLIKGGTLMFDRENPEIELNTEFILIVEGGKLEIGTEEEPYDSKAIITMHGNVRCTELPIFGCKVIGVRNGTLDFHGEYIPVTWTHLAETVPAGSLDMVLKQPVTWKAGDVIAIATTSDRNSMKENEEKTIASVSADGLTVTLTEPLTYQHISIVQTFGDRVVESRGEVGLLTRNILVRGTMNEQFVEVLPACEEEFSSGAAFSDGMQTCFAGKFGEELGSDEMGAIIIVSPKYKDQGLVEARIEYTEFSNVGQAFRVGRYPIHFHLPGNMSGSYIRGNAIHHSNNRACTLHDVSNLLVERNVAFNIKGLSFFLEDGVEQYNTLQYNLAIFTRMSNSLLNPDINPASFWIVNPNNKFRHNACAGGTHFCFWLRPASIPDGPSFTRDYCPNKVPFDEFHNNTAHSMGWYGFWIFGQSNHAVYDPHSGNTENGYCQGQRIQTTIGSFTTWNNKRGFEIVSGANIRLEDQTHMDHDFSAYEIFTANGPYGDDGPGIFNAVIVGHSEISDLTEGKNEACTPTGIRITDNGYTIKDTKFYNFDRDCHAMSMRLEEPHATATAARIENVEFINSPNKIFLDPKEGEQGMWFVDADGSLTGTAGASLVGDSATNPSNCVKDTTGELGGGGSLGGHPGSVCPSSVKFHRMKMIGIDSPSSLQFNAVNMENDFGVSVRPWTMMLDGWEALLPENTVNWLTFNSSEHVTNTSYTIEINEMNADEGNYVLIGHKFYQSPDRFTVLEDQAQVNASESLDAFPTYEANESGEWYFTNETESGISEMVYILSDKGPTGWANRKKRSAEVGNWGKDGWHHGKFSVYRCFYENCIPPPPPTLPPGRPLDFHSWSNQSAWESLGYTMPVAGDTVFIPPGAWFVMDIDPPQLKRIYLYGGLEIMDDADHKLEVEIILVQGGKFECGTQDVPHVNKFELILQGNHLTEDQPLPNGPNLGAKALGVFGFLDMHGVDTGVSFVKISSNAIAGDSTIELSEAVTWSVGSQIVISATSYELKETERRTITAVSGSTLSIDAPLEFTHTSETTTLADGTVINMSGEVGLLTKNVRIVGNDYAEIAEEEFGARVLVGEFEQDDIVYTGSARFSNVEFAVAGQEGWFDNFDPRYALAYLDTGDSVDADGAQKAKESYVKKCSFNYLYNSAIGIFGSNNVPVEDNVIYRFVNNGIFDEGNGNRINRNLITMGLAVARMKMQAFALGFFGCINNVRAFNYTMSNNVMAGCAQAGLYTLGSPCDMNYQMNGNEIHSAVHGIHLDSYGVSRPESGCVKASAFLVWKNYDYGIFTKSESSVRIDNIIAIDNGVGVLPYIYGPSADSHQFEEKFMTIEDSHIVAVSDNYDCEKEEKPDVFAAPKEGSRSWKGRDNMISGNRKSHHTGVTWPIFQSAYGLLDLTWQSALVGAEGTNPAMRGILNLRNITFANFGEACGSSDLVFRTNFKEDDVNWPISATDIKFLSVADSNKMYVDEPIASKINPSDCTDFDCDGMKKAMIIDNDGSVAGDSASGTIIPNSAFEWDGNPARGLGYYRVPKPMVTELNGDKIEYSDKMPNKGIYRDDSCVYNDNWRAYKCTGINHRLMIIESMDRDTKIRRLAPLAMLANPGSNGYIDLVNGPQDFSCCQGYVCAERLSTFYTMVATGIEYEIMFTSIPPQNFRLHMLHNTDGDAMRSKIWFPKQQRLDIYVDGRFVSPNNIDTTKEDYSLLPPGDSYIPALTETNGANYFDPNTGHLYVIVRDAIVNIKTQPIVVLKLGMTVPIENFFEENVIGNIAGLLGIDPSMIRITNIVREGSVGKKREASETITSVEFEIGPPPQETLENFMPPEYTYTTPSNSNVTENPLYTTTTIPSITTEWIAPEHYLTFEELENVQSILANNFQTGELGVALNLNVTGMSMENPIEPPAEPPAYTSPEERAEVTELTWAEQSLANNTEALENYQEVAYDVPHSLHISSEPVYVNEMAIIIPAIWLYVTTEEGAMITALGGDSDPWMCTVIVKSGPGALVGIMTVPFVEGLASFDDLRVDTAGDGYVLEFTISYPTNTNIAPVETLPIYATGRRLGLMYTNYIDLVAQNAPFMVTPDIWDEAIDMIVDASVISATTWECTASLEAGDNSGVLSGTLTITVPAGERSIVFDDLTIDEPGMDYSVSVLCSSADYEFQMISALSPPFHVHSFPVTGLLRKSGVVFSYRGPYQEVSSLISNFDSSMGTMTCTGCPEGSVPSRKKRDTAGQMNLKALKNVNFPECFGKGSC